MWNAEGQTERRNSTGAQIPCTIVLLQSFLVTTEHSISLKCRQSDRWMLARSAQAAQAETACMRPDTQNPPLARLLTRIRFRKAYATTERAAAQQGPAHATRERAYAVSCKVTTLCAPTVTLLNGALRKKWMHGGLVGGVSADRSVMPTAARGPSGTSYTIDVAGLVRLSRRQSDVFLMFTSMHTLYMQRFARGGSSAASSRVSVPSG